MLRIKKILKMTLITGIILSVLSFVTTITASASCPLTNLLFGGNGFGNNSLFSGNPFGNFGSFFGSGNNNNNNNNNCFTPNTNTNINNNTNCIGNTCIIDCTSCNNCAYCPECPQCEEPQATAYELKKGSTYSLKVTTNGSNLTVKSSDTNVATATLSQSYRNNTAIVYIRARNTGTATITICPVNNPNACEIVYVNVTSAQVTTQPPIITQPPQITPPPAQTFNTFAEEVLMYVNEARAANGLSALQLDPLLNEASEVRAKEVNTKFSHTRPNGTNCFTVLSEFGIVYNSCGENIAIGFNDAKAVVNAWMNSSGHRANILNPNFKFMGIGKSGTGWGQLFIG